MTRANHEHNGTLVYATVPQNTPDPTDPVRVWQKIAATITGADSDIIDSLELDALSAEPVSRIRTDAVLAVACAAARIDGGGTFVPRPDGGEGATQDRVIAYIDANVNAPIRRELAPTSTDIIYAKNVRAWTRKLPPSNAFLKSLIAVIRSESINIRDVAIAASALAGYQHELRSQGLPVEVSSANSAGESRWLNQPGDLIKVTARVERAIPTKTGATLYLLRTIDGDAIKWFAPRQKLGERLEAGAEIIMRGQVRGHETYNGERQTELFECRVERTAAYA